ncbi:MAG: hypothetical protein ACRC6U_03880 [Fusobacteriaceae bacterium]
MELSKVRDFEKELLTFIKNNTDVIAKITEKKALDDDLEKSIVEAIKSFKASFN